MTFKSEMPPGSTAVLVPMYTALDFDSVGNLGSVQALEDYSSCQVNTLKPGGSFTRSIKPCVKISTQQASSNVNSTLSRIWQDSGATGTPWFGIRSIVAQGSVAYNILVTTTIWYAFRNQL